MSFCDHVLDRERDRAIVLVTPFLGEQRFVVDPDVLAEELGSLADVVIVQPSASWTITDQCGYAYTCHSGAVKVLSIPGAESVLLNNGLMVARYLDQRTQDGIIDLIISRVKMASKLPRQVAGKRPQRAASAPKDGPKAVADAVEVARKECKRLVFLPSAISSAARSPFRNPAQVLEALRGLNAAAGEMNTKGLKGSTELREALRSRSLFNAYRPRLSDTALGMYAKDYTFAWNGEQHLFSQHLTLGVRQGDDKTISIHFDIDDDGNAVIAHVGAHGRNTKTN